MDEPHTEAENPGVDVGGVSPFRSLAEDTLDASIYTGPLWSAHVSPHVSLDLHPAAVVRSVTWPGAVAVAKGSVYACMCVMLCGGNASASSSVSGLGRLPHARPSSALSSSCFFLAPIGTFL